jgi:hypothetical protein
MKKSAFLAALGLFCLTAAQMIGAPVAYGINSAGIWSIDLSSGTQTLLLNSPTVVPNGDGLALNRATNDLYWRQGPVDSQNGSTGPFASYNLGNNAFTSTPVAFPTGDVESTTNGTANGSTYYFITQNADNMWNLNYNAGGVTGTTSLGDVNGNVPFNFGDISYHEPSGTIYGYTFQSFFQVQTNGTGYTVLARPAGSPDYLELGYDDAVNLMYAHEFSTGKWFTIDLGTGVLTDIGITTQGFNDIALRGSAVPEPSTYALIGAGLGAVALRARRARK